MIALTDHEQLVWHSLLPDCHPAQIEDLFAALPICDARPPKLTSDIYSSEHVVTLSWSAATGIQDRYHVHIHVEEQGVTLGNCHIPPGRPKRQGFGRAVLAVAATLAGACITPLLEAEATTEGLPTWLKLGARLRADREEAVLRHLQRDTPELMADLRIENGDWGDVLRGEDWAAMQLTDALTAVKGNKLMPVYWDEARLTQALTNARYNSCRL